MLTCNCWPVSTSAALKAPEVSLATASAVDPSTPSVLSRRSFQAVHSPLAAAAFCMAADMALLAAAASAWACDRQRDLLHAAHMGWYTDSCIKQQGSWQQGLQT